MNNIDISPWQHSHTFGQDKKKHGESRTIIVIVITTIMMILEVSGGIIFGSMALLADGIHMASHSLALLINVFAYIYSRKMARDKRFSFGTGKVNALGGFTGAVLLACFALMMAWGSVERLLFPVSIDFNSAILVSVIGLIVNGVSVFLLGDNHHHDHHHSHEEHHHDHDHHHHGHHDHHHHDHNLRSAYLHVLADALTSITAIVALLSGKYLGLNWMDPVMGIVGSILVAKWSIGLIRQSSHVLLDYQAEDAVLKEVIEVVESDNHVRIADLHVWSIGPNIYSVLMTIVSNRPIEPSECKQKLDSQKFPHITVEVQHVHAETKNRGSSINT
jgi:cation diffusion facilitator family transporter